MSRRMEDLTPSTRALCTELIARCRAEGIELAVISTLRTAAHQAALYAQGRQPHAAVNALRARADLSPITEAHNRIVTATRHSMHQLGLAFDVVVIKAGKPCWDAHEYQRPGAIGEALGLRWGGRFQFRDYGHFELPPAGAGVSVAIKHPKKGAGNEKVLEEQDPVGQPRGSAGPGLAIGNRLRG